MQYKLIFDSVLQIEKKISVQKISLEQNYSLLSLISQYSFAQNDHFDSCCSKAMYVLDL